MKGESWTAEQDAAARKMAAEGATAAAIAEVVGRTRNAVLGWCHREDVTLNGKKGDGSRAGRAAANAEARAYVVWRDDEVATIRRLAADGRTVPEIAAALGRKTRQVRDWLDRNQVSYGKIPATMRGALALRPAAAAPPAAAPDVAGAGRHEISADLPAPRPVRFLDAGLRHCRRPLWRAPAPPIAEKFVCGAAVQPGTSWCADCAPLLLAPAAAPKPRRVAP